MLQRLYDEGQIYKDNSPVTTSVRQEQFITDKERGPDGEFGPEWGEVEFREEENYYFKLEPAQKVAASVSRQSSGLRHSRFSPNRIA